MLTIRSGKKGPQIKKGMIDVIIRLIVNISIIFHKYHQVL